MILLTVEEIIELHDKLIDRTGGSHGLRDRNLLESAVYSTVSGFEGYDTCVTPDKDESVLTDKISPYLFRKAL